MIFKNLSTILMAVVVSAAFAVGVAAQAKKMDTADFDAETKAAFAASRLKDRREITRIETFENGKRVQESTVTEEFLPPDRSRWVSVERIGTRKSTAEWLILGGDKFKRTATGGWFKDVTYKPPVEMPAPPAVEDDGTKYSEKKGKLAGKTVTILKRVETISPADGGGTSVFNIQIDTAGLIVKREQTDTESRGKGNYKTAVTTYEYDPKGLTIVLPVKQ